MASKATNEALPGMADSLPRRGGPIYRAVVKAVNAHVESGGLDLALDAASIELAKSLAHQVDMVGGYKGMKREPYAFASLSRELRGLLETLTGSQMEEAIPKWLTDTDPDDASPDPAE